MIEHDINKQNNFICGWYAEDTSLCDELIEYFYASPIKGPGKVVGPDGLSVYEEFKKSTDCPIDDRVLLRKYVNFLQQSTDLYMEKYPYCNESLPWTIKETTQIQHYNPGGGFYNWHAERCTLNVLDRHLVFMTYLNDVTDQGETEFYYQNVKIKPEKGLSLIWPADWTFTHRGVPSPTQEKFIVTGWYNFFQN